MYKTQISGNVRYVRTIDRVCPQCRAIYSSVEHSRCLKCGTQLIQTGKTTEKGYRPYCWTEVTIYPQLPEKVSTRYAEQLNKSKALGTAIRFKIWGRYDEAQGIAYPDNVVPHLDGRQIMVEFNSPPTHTPFATKDHVQCIEVAFELRRAEGDRVELLGHKKASEAIIHEHQRVETAQINHNPPPANGDVAAIMNAMEVIRKQIAALSGGGGDNTPAPTKEVYIQPEDIEVVEDYPAPVPDDMTNGYTNQAEETNTAAAQTVNLFQI